MSETLGKNLSICQDCLVNPATYGDGLTWSRCSECQSKMGRNAQKVEAPEPIKQSFSHEIVPRLTSIIMPIYMVNGMLFHHTGNAIGSIREHTRNEFTPYELVIVDNGSPVQPPDLKAYYADKVIKNEENLGVTYAWNQGIRMSQGEYIVLINNDVQVFDYWLPCLVDGLASYDLVMAHPMYSQTEPFARAVEAKNIQNQVLKRNSKYSDFKDFSCVIFKRSLLEEVGVFDEAFFSYCSDADFLRRMKELGKTYACCELVATSHISDATGQALKEKTKEIIEQDQKTYAAKWDNVPEKAVVPENRTTEDTSDTSLVRTPDTGDAIYFIENGIIHHVTSPEALHALGFEFGQEKSVELEGLMKRVKNGEDITVDNAKKYV